MSMKDQSIMISWIFVILIASVQFIPNFGSIDRASAQFLYLALITLTSFLYTLRELPTKGHVVLYHNKIITVLFGLSCLGLISTLWAFNPTESLINYFEILLIVLIIYNLSHHLTQIKPNFKQIAFLFVFLLASDIFIMLVSFLSIYDFTNPPPRTNALLGFSSNLNVTGFSLTFRIPFVIFLILTSKKVINKIIYFLLMGLTIFFIIVSFSRGAILTFILLFSSFIFFQYFFVKTQRKLILFMLLFTVGVFGVQSFLYQNGNTFIDRVETLTPSKFKSDSSSNERLAWYKAAFEGIKENPLLGHGFGNWKIVGNKYVSQYIQQYIVSKYVHNDFLEIFAELGLVGLVLFIWFFILLFVKLYRRRHLLNNSAVVGSVIVFSLLVYLFDSNLNFPFQRPISLVNLSLLVAFIVSLDSKKIIPKKHSFIFSLLTLIGLISVFISTYKVHRGFIDEVNFIDRISHKRGFKDIDIAEINQLNFTYPNINYTTIPILTFKALFNWKNGYVQEAKKLFKQGNKINPYLYVAEANLAQIFFEESEIDSSYYYAKKAFYGLPNNERHTNIFQTAIGAKGDMNELNTLFDIVKDRRKESIYANHIALTANLKVYDSFTTKDKEIAKEAIKLFPDNIDIKKHSFMIMNSPNSIYQANKADQAALEFFNRKQYKKAILKWELAKKAIPTEPAYYLNIAQAQTTLGDYKSSNTQLDSISIIGTSKNNGHEEYLRAMNKLLVNDESAACQNLIIAYRKGYKKESVPLIKKLKCKIK